VSRRVCDFEGIASRIRVHEKRGGEEGHRRMRRTLADPRGTASFLRDSSRVCDRCVHRKDH
jgi:hypothetical protein